MLIVIISLNVAFWIVILAGIANAMYNDKLIRDNRRLIQDNWKLIADNRVKFDAWRTAQAQARIAKSKADLDKAILRNKAFMMAIPISGGLLVAALIVKLIWVLK